MKGTKKKSSNWVIGGIVGGVVFIVFTFLGVSFLLSIGAAVAAFFGSVMLFSPGKSTMEFTASGISEEEVRSALSEGYQKIATMQSLVQKIPVGEAKSLAKDILDLAVKIVDDFKKDPKDIKVGRQFLNYYMDAVNGVLTRYIDLASHSIRSNEVNDALGKVVAILRKMKTAFEMQLGKLLRDDVMDLETELKLLENTIRAEGLDSDAPGNDQLGKSSPSGKQ